jgi:hypothetical protein
MVPFSRPIITLSKEIVLSFSSVSPLEIYWPSALTTLLFVAYAVVLCRLPTRWSFSLKHPEFFQNYISHHLEACPFFDR